MNSSSLPRDAFGADFNLNDLLDSLPPWVRNMIRSATDEAQRASKDHRAHHETAREHLVQADTADQADRSTSDDGPGTGRPSGGPDNPFGAFGPEFMRMMMSGGGRPPWGAGPGPWGSGGRGRGRGRGRAGRGDIRAAILTLLAEEPMHGYQLMQEMSARSDGAWRPSPGSVYPTLSQLEDEGLVRGKKDGGRRIFRLTEDGETAAGEADDAPWDSVRPRGPRAEGKADDLGGLREEIASTAGAVMAVATSGRPEQVEAARTILADARKALYRLLADEE